MVTCDDVKHGKPDPECYKLAIDRLGVGDGGHVVVVEDSAVGLHVSAVGGVVWGEVVVCVCVYAKNVLAVQTSLLAVNRVGHVLATACLYKSMALIWF